MRPVALVTGGARGIGRAIVETLAVEYSVVFTHRRTAPDEALTEIATALPCDLSGEGAPEALVVDVMDRFGRIDLIVNNAGIMLETPPEATDLTAHRAIFEVNLLAPMALLGAALPHLTSGAVVINISSQNARLPALAAPAYSASKAALDTWTRAMAKVLGPRGIRVNAVAPGATDIPEAPRPDALRALFLKDTALGQLAATTDIAEAVRFLASARARLITGEILTVNGGYRL